MNHYRELKTPINDKEGLINNVQMAINALELDNQREAILTLVDLIDSLQGCKFQWIDENRVPIGDPEEAEEPIQRTQENSQEVTRAQILYRNHYYI